MTAWPLNCTSAANAAENVFWRRGTNAAHGLLIDTLAVPLRFEEAAKPEATPAPWIEPETKASLGQRIARLFAVEDLRLR